MYLARGALEIYKIRSGLKISAYKVETNLLISSKIIDGLSSCYLTNQQGISTKVKVESIQQDGELEFLKFKENNGWSEFTSIKNCKFQKFAISILLNTRSIPELLDFLDTANNTMSFNSILENFNYFKSECDRLIKYHSFPTRLQLDFNIDWFRYIVSQYVVLNQVSESNFIGDSIELIHVQKLDRFIKLHEKSEPFTLSLKDFIESFQDLKVSTSKRQLIANFLYSRVSLNESYLNEWINTIKKIDLFTTSEWIDLMVDFYSSKKDLFNPDYIKLNTTIIIFILKRGWTDQVKSRLQLICGKTALYGFSLFLVACIMEFDSDWDTLYSRLVDLHLLDQIHTFPGLVGDTYTCFETTSSCYLVASIYVDLNQSSDILNPINETSEAVFKYFENVINVDLACFYACVLFGKEDVLTDLSRCIQSCCFISDRSIKCLAALMIWTRIASPMWKSIIACFDKARKRPTENICKKIIGLDRILC